jgi:hypothetical protein
MSGTPAPTPRIDGAAAATMMREQMARAPWRSWTASFTLLGSHDTARLAWLVSSPIEPLHGERGVIELTATAPTFRVWRLH